MSKFVYVNIHIPSPRLGEKILRNMSKNPPGKVQNFLRNDLGYKSNQFTRTNMKDGFRKGTLNFANQCWYCGQFGFTSTKVVANLIHSITHYYAPRNTHKITGGLHVKLHMSLENCNQIFIHPKNHKGDPKIKVHWYSNFDVLAAPQIYILIQVTRFYLFQHIVEAWGVKVTKEGEERWIDYDSVRLDLILHINNKYTQEKRILHIQRQRAGEIIINFECPDDDDPGCLMCDIQNERKLVRRRRDQQGWDGCHIRWRIWTGVI